MVYGTEWNATLLLVINALNDDTNRVVHVLAGYLNTRLAPPNTYSWIEVSTDVVKLIKAVAPATSLTSHELAYVLDEMDIILRDEEREGAK